MKAASFLIVGSAPISSGAAHYGRLVTNAQRVIAADGGLLVCLEAGRLPELVVGDFDSTPPEALERAASLGADVRRFPARKDMSDLDLALGVARELGATGLTLTAAFSGRLDHTLAALGTLVSAADLEAVADEPDWTVHPLDATLRPRCELHEAPGTVVSVIAVGGVAVVNAEGMSYPMSATTLSPLSSHGLSNIAVAAVQRISVTQGSAVVVVNRTPGVLPLQ